MGDSYPPRPALPLLGASGTCGVQHGQKHEADVIIIVWTDKMTGPESSSKKPKAHSHSGHLSLMETWTDAFCVHRWALPSVNRCGQDKARKAGADVREAGPQCGQGHQLWKRGVLAWLLWPWAGDFCPSLRVYLYSEDDGGVQVNT